MLNQLVGPPLLEFAVRSVGEDGCRALAGEEAEALEGETLKASEHADGGEGDAEVHSDAGLEVVATGLGEGGTRGGGATPSTQSSQRAAQHRAKAELAREGIPP